MVKVDFELKRGHIFIFIFIFMLFGIESVVAYNAAGVGGIPSIMGHGVDEINWGRDIPQMCMNGRCISDWDDAGP